MSNLINNVNRYRIKTQFLIFVDQSHMLESLSGISTTGTRKSQQENGCLLKLMSAPECHQSLTLTCVDRCSHISFVTTSRVWVSDRQNLILTNTCVPLHRVEDLCSGLYGGLHTVNNVSEMTYIDRNFNINKLSKDL